MKLHHKAITSVMITILFLAGLFLYLFYKGSRQSYDKDVKYLSSQMEHAINNQKNALQIQYLARLESFIRKHPDIINTFKEKDRELLYKQTLPAFDVLKKDIKSLFGFSFVLPDATTLLRMQKPDFFGDNVSEIPFAQHLLKTKKTSIGFAVTKIGAFYRIIVPVYDDSTYVGAIGWSLRPSLLTEHIDESECIFYAVLVNSERFKKLVKSDAEHHEIKGHILFEQSKNTSIFRKLPSDFNPHISNQKIVIGAKTFIIHAEPLKNFADQPIGDILLAIDITKETVLFQKQITNAIMVTLLTLIISFFILYFSFGKLIANISKLNETLEIRVKKRTEELTEVNAKLLNSLEEVKTLRGIIPICSYCKKIRDDKGAWEIIEAYISEHSDATFSHGICPDCLKKIKKDMK